MVICVRVILHYRHRDTIAVPPLKQPWRKRRAQETERKAMKEIEREMKEAKDREKEVCICIYTCT